MTRATSAIKVTVLGSGTCVPSLRRSACALLVQVGEHKLLLDVGPGTMRRLLESGTAPADITHICCSHFHPDHISELVPFLFACKYGGAAGCHKPLTIMGGSGMRRFYDQLKGVFGSWMAFPPDVVTLIEMSNDGPDRIALDGFTLASQPMVHRSESIGIRISAPGGTSMVYSGDTDDCEELIALARHTDLLVCEAALPDELKVSGHLTPSLAGRIATRAQVQRLMLTHFYPECDRVDIEAECRQNYAGPLILAEDLLEIELA